MDTGGVDPLSFNDWISGFDLEVDANDLLPN